MSRDFETFNLFEDSNFDAFDSGSDRYPAVLKEGLRRHQLTLDDVLAVHQDMGLWAVCRTGLLRGDLRGMFKKRIEIEDLIPYASIASVQMEQRDPNTWRITLHGRPGKNDTIDVSTSAPNYDRRQAEARCSRLARLIDEARRSRASAVG